MTPIECKNSMGIMVEKDKSQRKYITVNKSEISLMTYKILKRLVIPSIL